MNIVPTLPDWLNVVLPEQVSKAQTTLMAVEQRLLFSVMRDHFCNFGHVIDAGCFLGGSTLAMANGLLANPLWQRNRRISVIHSYDRFVVEPWAIGAYLPGETPLDTSFEPIFRRNIADVAHLVEVHSGDIAKSGPAPQPIELLFVDCAKHWTTSDYIVRAFFPHLVPGHSIVIQQDYLYPTHTGWLPVTMEYFSEYFEIVDHTELNSVVFLYRKKIPAEKLGFDLIQSLPTAEIRRLADAAIARFPGKQQREVLEKSRDHLQEWLARENWDALRKS